MGPVVVVVAAVIGKEPLQVALVEGDNMVQQVTPTTLNRLRTFVPYAREGKPREQAPIPTRMTIFEVAGGGLYRSRVGHCRSG